MKQRGEEEREEGGRGRRAKARIMWGVTITGTCVWLSRDTTLTLPKLKIILCIASVTVAILRLTWALVVWTFYE